MERDELTKEQRAVMRAHLKAGCTCIHEGGWFTLLEMVDIGERALTLLRERVRGVEVSDWISRVDALVAEIDGEKK